ncbi:hypothetical protein [Streptomyces sp. NBC_01237]|uniref:hypothetical protein n=1 Tax=Streptomyces sp. NBC_01237 TaxID=2903790 RepID=UPI002DDB5BAC|nr:hypothetical protein [Streptomyces sp. NBC_01237]WRZ78762.1 hypothetical protein OG251_44865 [Streptomyces sp. NBC_01237]
MSVLLPIPSDDDMERAFDLFESLLEKAGDGIHTLTLSVQGLGGAAVRQFHFAQREDHGFLPVIEMGIPFCDLLGVAVKGTNSSVMVMRTWGTEDRVCGWKFHDGKPKPLTKSQLFDAYCYSSESGEYGGPLSDAEYTDAPDV